MVKAKVKAVAVVAAANSPVEALLRSNSVVVRLRDVVAGNRRCDLSRK